MLCRTMAEFPKVLTALMQLEDLTQAGLEQSSGIDRTTISRLQRGERLPNREQLGQLLVGISKDRERRLELLLAHLRDEAEIGRTAGITSSDYILRSAQNEVPQTPGTLVAELELIREECAKHDDIRDVIVDMASMIRRQRDEIANVRAEVYPFPHFATKAAVIAEERDLQALVKESIREADAKATGKLPQIPQVPKP